MKTSLREFRKTIILLILITCTVTSSFARSNDNKTYLSNELNVNGLTFKIDPRIELLYTVGYIAGYPFMNGLDIKYYS
jgi:hypothetical protein